MLQLQFLLHQGNNSQKWPMPTMTVIANGDGNCNGQWWLRRQWLMARGMAMATAMADGNATETVAAMVDGDRNGNGRRWWQWATAAAMAAESATTTEMAMAITIATSMARRMMTKAGLPLHVPAMCSAMAGATPCLHPHGHNRKVHSPALRHGGDTAKSVSSLSRGRVPDSSPLILFLFIIYNYCSVYWTTLCLPPASFRHSRTLSAHWCSTSSTTPRTTSAYWQSTPAPIAFLSR